MDDVATWAGAEEQVRAELRRIDDVVHEIRSGTRDLRWQGPGAGRFRWRTERRMRELGDQRAILTVLLSLVRRAELAARAALTESVGPGAAPGARKECRP